MLALINDILDLSKIEASKFELETLDFDLTRLLDGLVTVRTMQAKEKGLDLHGVMDRAVPTLLSGDPGRLRQILDNLVSNAIKFTWRGGITIRIDVVAETPLDVQLRFAVRDTGIGISKDKLGSVFEKFRQVDSTIARQYGGSGLGLVISKQLAEMMGGEIGATSEEGLGSEFWFTARFQQQACKSPLLAATASSAAVVPPAVLTSLAGRAGRILLAEDNLINQKVIRSMLKKLGLCADVVTNGLEVMQRVASTAYDLILMDVQMPLMDGLETTRQIRACQVPRVDPQLLIVAMTAHAMKIDCEKCMAAGMNDYLTKPVSLQDLAVMLDKWLPPHA
jgi:CheY-like chemotaxis protein